MNFLKLSVQCRKKPNFAEQIAEQTASRTAIPYAKKLLSLSKTTVWPNPNRSRTRMIAQAKVVAEALVIGSMQAKLHIPQQPIKKHSEPSKLACLPAEYASKNITRKGASIGKL